MCGIAGHVRLRGLPDSASVAAMVGGIRHRGPDDSGLWTSREGECVLGHARLSVIDLSPSGHQPMIDPETGNAIVFNGEIYNFRELRRECEAAGDHFRSHSDTEVILALYRRRGMGCLGSLRGMFAFALWDESRKSLFLARDRVGKKPLNYSLGPEGLTFCSEIDPLARHPGVSRQIDMEALDLYLQCQYIPAPWTIYRGIRKLPPACYAVFGREGFRMESYWNVDYRRKAAVTETEALDGFEEKLSEAVRLRMIADVPTGALLSGGVDSSVIVALMARSSGERVHTFSMGFREEEFNELPFAREAAEICGTDHHPEIVESRVGELLPQLARHYGEPFADSSAVPSFLVARAARRHVTVVLNGDGGDELLGGYSRYAMSRLQSLASGAVSGIGLSPSRLVDWTSRLAEARDVPRRALRKLLTEYAHPELRSVNMYAGFWDDRARARLLGGHNTPVLASWRTAWLAEAMERAEHPVDRMLWHDNRTYLPGDLLVKMDIASMHCGLETRSPLLDHEVIEYCATLPASYKVRGGVGKYLLKKLAERYFPKAFVHRSKMGFGIPVAEWLRGGLRPMLESTLRDARLMEPLDGSVVRGTLDDFLGGADRTARIWTLFMYGVWRRETGGAI